MKRTTIFLDEDLDLRLKEVSARTGRPQAEIVRDALDEYLRRHGRPWPASIGMGRSPDAEVTSATVKDWIHEQWDTSVPSLD